MNKTLLKIIWIFLVIDLIITWIWFYRKSLDNKVYWPNVCIQKQCFNVELARTEAERELWLMHRKSLPELSWMLFIFDSVWEYKFWMKDTPIALDIIWIDSNKKIVSIKKNAKPCALYQCDIIDPKVKSLYVLEVNWWATDKYNIKVWDNIEFINIK